MTQKTPEYLSESESWYKLNIARKLQNIKNEPSTPKIYNALKWQFQLLQGAVSETLKNRVLKIVSEKLVSPHHRVMDAAG